MRHQRGEEGLIVGDAVDEEAVERIGHPGDRPRTVVAVGDELRDQRIEIDGDFGALDYAAVDPDGRLAVPSLDRRTVGVQAADRGQEIAIGVLGVEAAIRSPSR